MLRALPRRDEAFDDESVLGYALRMAEANRIRGLAGTARLLGCGSVVRSGASHAAAIAQLFGASPSRLISLAPHQMRRDGELHVSLMGCEFSRPWLLRSQRPQVCPTCLAAQGYARADWDVLFMTRCRLHRTQLQDQCPNCKETLCWRRMTLTRCPCGQDLCRIDPGTPTDGVPRWMTAWLANRMGLPAVGSEGSVDARDLDEFFDALSVDGAMRVPTAVAAERLVDWLKRFDIDVDLVAAAGEHFDLEEPGFTRPPPRPRAMLVMMLGAVILFYGALTAGLFGALTPPVIQVKSSQIWYAVTNDRATKFHLGGDPAPVIESANCGNATAIAKTTLYPSHDVEVLCELMSSDKGKSKLHGAQMGQMLLAAIATPLLLFAGMRLFRSLRRADKANKLYKLVNQRRSAQDPKPEAVETSAQGAGAGDDAAKGPSGP